MSKVLQLAHMQALGLWARLGRGLSRVLFECRHAK